MLKITELAKFKISALRLLNVNLTKLIFDFKIYHSELSLVNRKDFIKNSLIYDSLKLGTSLITFAQKKEILTQIEHYFFILHFFLLF